MGRYLMSSRVGALKWLGALQLILGLLLLAVTAAYFGIDFDDTANDNDAASATYDTHFLITTPTILLAIGAGAAGAAMSRYRGLVHNISAKNTAVALSVMNGFSAIWTIAFSGTYIFFDIDKRDVLDGSAPDWEKSVGALIVINLVIALFDMLVAFAFVTLGCLWMPSESHLDRPAVGRAPPPPAAEPYYRGPEPEVVDTYYRSPGPYGYPNAGYYPGAGAYPSGGYRTLPALKY